MKARNPKKSFLLSVLSLLLCVSMFVGTTFAWFSETITSSNNLIMAGNLDVELYYKLAEEGEDADAIAKKEWKAVKDDTALFDEAILWEPGYTHVVYLKIENKGSLALKYQLGLNVVSEKQGVNVDGVKFNLSDYIQFGAVERVSDELLGYFQTRDDALNALSVSWAIADGYGTANSLLAGTEDYLAMVVYMPTSVGNEVNHLEGEENRPEIKLGLNLYATQMAHEVDSFGNDYDANASFVVSNGAELANAVANVEDGGVIYMKPGDYTLNTMMVIDGKSVSIIGLGKVNITTTAAQHMFTIQDSANPESDVVVNLTNINLNGAGVSKHGINVKYNVMVNLNKVTTKNTGWAGVLLDNANKYTDGNFYDGTATVVNMTDCDINSVSLDCLPVVDTHAYANAGVDTYAYLNYNAATKLGSIEVQSITKTPANIFINGVSADNIGKVMNLYVTNDAELAEALNTIKTNSEYWNKEVFVYMAAGEYAGDHVINQYPLWNGVVGAGTTANNYPAGVPAGEPVTNVTFVGEAATTYAATVAPVVKFTGNVTLNGFGNSNTGFKYAAAVTNFQNIAFDAKNSPEANGEDAIVMYVTAAANNVTFDGCLFENASHVTVGGATPNGVGTINVLGCVFNNGGTLSGGIAALNVIDTFVNNQGGFVNQSMAGTITIENCDITCGKYFLRTAKSGSGVNLTATSTTITVNTFEGENNLVNFRSGTKNCTAAFVDCTITPGYSTAGVDKANNANLYIAGKLIVDEETGELVIEATPEQLEASVAVGGKVVMTEDTTAANKIVEVGSYTGLDLNENTLNNALLVKEGAELDVADGEINIAFAGLQNVNGTATVTNVTMNAGSAADYSNITRGENAETVYNNVTINSNGGGIAAANGAKVVFNGGEVAIVATTTSPRYNIYAEGAGSEVIINDGDFSFTKLTLKRAYVYAGAGTKVIINGGTFGVASTRSGYTAGILGSGEVIITGGTFGFDPSNWVADGYQAVKTGTTWVVSAI